MSIKRNEDRNVPLRQINIRNFKHGMSITLFSISGKNSILIYTLAYFTKIHKYKPVDNLIRFLFQLNIVFKKFVCNTKVCLISLF